MKLILLAAGQGTRFYPTTKDIPKAMVRVDGKPMIEWVLSSFKGLVDSIIIVINDETGQVLQAYLGSDYYGIPISYAVQPLGVERGTWPSLLKGSEYLDDTDGFFIVSNSDDIFDAEEMKSILNDSPALSMGVSRTVMPKKYMGMQISEGYITGTRSNMGAQTDTVLDIFCNGFHILPRELLQEEGVGIAGGEYGLPQTIFKNLEKYPCRAIEMKHWISINKPEDIRLAKS